MGLTAVRSVRAADPDQPTSRHVYFPTPLHRAVLDEALLGANCQARLVIVLYLSQNSISSTTFFPNCTRELHIIQSYIVFSQVKLVPGL